MPPPRKSTEELGSVAAHGNGYRARVCIGGKECRGPQRATRMEADADLHRARECKSRAEMQMHLAEALVKATARNSKPEAERSDGQPDLSSSEDGAEQPAVQARKRLRTKQAPGAANEKLGVAMFGGVSQPAVARDLPSRSESAVATDSGALQKGSSGDAPKPAAESGTHDEQKKILLQRRRPHYDAIKDRRKKWEARPLFNDEAKGGRRSWIDALAIVGREVVLQSGAGTNDRVRIAEVRRYADGDPLYNMVAALGSDLLPDVADTRARMRVYEGLYGNSRCAKGFVAMRLEFPQSHVCQQKQQQLQRTVAVTRTSATATTTASTATVAPTARLSKKTAPTTAAPESASGYRGSSVMNMAMLTNNSSLSCVCSRQQ